MPVPGCALRLGQALASACLNGSSRARRRSVGDFVGLAECQREELPPERLRYLRHDLRTPLPETGFDVACNIFSSFGYGTEEEDVAIFRTLRDAVRPGGRVLVETNHRDLTCTVIARGSKASKRLADGTLFLDEPDFDPISGVVRLNWYWSGLGRRVYVPPR